MVGPNDLVDGGPADYLLFAAPSQSIESMLFWDVVTIPFNPITEPSHPGERLPACYSNM